jgi:hypothetical protein
MRRTRTGAFSIEDIFVGCVALIAAVVCALALLDVPAATATRGVSYTDFVRAPTLEQPALPETEAVTPPRFANRPAADQRTTELAAATVCSPVAQEELQRLLALCRG